MERREGWRLVGGSTCLDFVNTVGGRVSRSRTARARDLADHITRDDLTGYGALLHWSRVAGLLSPSEASRLEARARESTASAGRTFARAVALREALYRIGKCLFEGWPLPSQDLETLDREVRDARQRQRLVDGRGRLATAWAEGEDALDRMLWPVALSAAELFGSDALAQLKQCPGEDCGWLFLDTTRNHSRQWCEMADCGNLAKVRRFRQRARKARRAS